MTQSTKDGHCKEMLERFSEYLDGELDDLCCQELERHLNDCPECVDTVEGMRSVLRLCKEAREAADSVQPSPTFKTRLRAVISNLPPDDK